MFLYCGTPWGFDMNSWLSLTPRAIQNSHVPFYLIARNPIQIKMLTGFSQKKSELARPCIPQSQRKINKQAVVGINPRFWQ